MGTRTWDRPVGAETNAHVALQPSDAGGDTRYEIAFPFLVGDQSADDVQVTGDGRVVDHQIRSSDGIPVSDLTVSVPAGSPLERLIVRSRPERIVIHLPSTELLERCDRTLDGDGEAAQALIDAFRSPVQIPIVCGSFLGPTETVRLVAELVARDRYVASLLHSYRYAVVRAALVSRTGIHVGTFRELRSLVDGLDEVPEIGSVSVVEALGDVIGTVHGSRAETERLLDSLGVGFEQLDERSDGLFTACFLAHIARTDGVEAAEAFEVPRKLPPRGHYDRRKRAVFLAEYGERGAAWRRLLNAARRESADEIGYVLAYTLYWTGEESRSDSRTPELLLRGAELVAGHKRLRKIATKARYGRLMAAGHRLRGTHCWGPSVANFEAARELAAEEPFLGAWEPILARGLVRSRQLSKAGDHERAAWELDATIEDLLEAERPSGVANRSVRHAVAQRCEIKSLRYRSDEPARARELLEEARDHYAAIGFDRSVQKVERMLAAMAEEAALPAPAEADAPPAPVAEAAPSEGTADTAADGSEPAAPDEIGDDWLERIEYPDEATERDYEDRFDEPYPS